MEQLRLFKASHENAVLSYEQFATFMNAHPNPFVSTRAEDVIRSAIGDESLFFVENEDQNIVAATGFYKNGPENDLWGELGSTLVDPAYRGVQLQPAMYQHIISLKWLSDWAPHVIAIVDEINRYSRSNIERCGFNHTRDMPQALQAATPRRDWSPVLNGKMMLYELSEQGIVESLLFVANKGQEHSLINRKGTELFSLYVDFTYLAQPNACDVLRDEAQAISKRNLMKKI